MNKVILMGRLTRDPEIRYSQSAEPLAIGHYSLAVNRRFKKQGEPDVDFIDCVTFSKSAEFAERFLKKGMMIAVSGRLQVSNWDDKETGQKRWKTEVIVEEQDFAESKAAFQARQQNQGDADYSAAPPPSDQPNSGQPNSGFAAIAETLDDDDLPF